MKNLRLKMMILDRFGSQSVFAQKLKIREPIVSRVVNGFGELDEKQRKAWAKSLRCQVSDIFPASKNQ